jgi:RNA polymerase sigma factor (sigma-70 family)
MGMWDTKTDRELVRAYADAQDGAALTELVARHQGLVYRTCVRMLGNAQDAQDAAQSVFIVLSKKAACLRREGSLNGWLHDVARKVCLEALRTRSNRVRREGDFVAWQASATADTVSEAEAEAVLRSVDQELNGLSPKLREAVLMRYLQGYSEREAAVRAGCPLGTMKRRASDGLAGLRSRLAKRGFALGLPSLVFLLETEAHAMVPSTFVSSTVTAVKAYAAGAAMAAVPSNVATLTKGVLDMMFWNKVKTVTAVAASCTIVAAIGALTVHRALAGDAAAPTQGRAWATTTAGGPIDVNSLWGKFESLDDSGTLVIQVPNTAGQQGGGPVTWTEVRLKIADGREDAVRKSAATVAKGDRIVVGYVTDAATRERFAWSIKAQ